MAEKLRGTRGQVLYGELKNPTQEEVTNAIREMKPPRIMSNGFTVHGEKKVGRAFHPAKADYPSDDLGDMYTRNRLEEEISMAQKPYFLHPTKHDDVSIYDLVNHSQSGYDQKLHRDDRAHAKSRGLKVNDEEIQRIVPASNNNIYGHPQRKILEDHSRKFGRGALVKEEFYRRNGVPQLNMVELKNAAVSNE